MKKILGFMFAFIFCLANANAMSYEEARDRARFLTDKMAYELNLNDEQYNDAYEINLDYLMNISTASDASGIYWEYRNADLRHILYDWQYNLFCVADYFFRPVIWGSAGWFFPVFNIYPATRFYYNPPRVYHVYRGGHFKYRFNHPVSFYANRRPVWTRGLRGESRGPIEKKPVHHAQDGRGFRFETTGRNEGNRQPARNTERGFRIGEGKNPVQTTRPNGTNNIRTSTSRTNGTTGTVSPTRSSSGSTTSSRTGNATGTQRRNNTSNYNRPSSTRTTVNRTNTGGTVRTTSSPNTPKVQRGTTTSASGTVKKAQTASRSSVPSRSSSQRK